MGTPSPAPESGRRPGAGAAAAGFVVALVVAVAGCRSGPPPPAGTVKVTGVVRYDGAPLPRGTVQFGAVSGNDCGTGKIQPDGRFTVWLKPGDYGVAVIAFDGIERVDAAGIPLPQKELIPERYFTTADSGLTASVDKDKRTFEFDLRK